MWSSGREPEWTEYKGIRIPIAGQRKDELKILRLLGPQGQSPEEWSREWRSGHSAHYRQLILSLQRMDVEDRLTDIRARVLLVGARLDREDLAGLDLRSLNLTNASFRAANLDGANLQNATLVKADFSRASLHLANLSGADVSGSDMTMAYSKGALYENANMRRVWFRRAFLDGSLFYNSDLRLSDFAQARCWGTRFDGADLEQVHGLDTAVFVRWLRPGGAQVWSDTPQEGWLAVYENPMASTSFRANAGRQPYDP